MNAALLSRAKRNELYMGMQRSMPRLFKSRRLTLMTNEMLSVAVDTVRDDSEIDRDSLTRELTTKLKERMDQPRYGSAFFSFVLWWLIPMFVKWFVSQWFRDKERAKSQ